MKMQIKEFSKLVGVSVRTLRKYYQGLIQYMYATSDLSKILINMQRGIAFEHINYALAVLKRQK